MLCKDLKAGDILQHDMRFAAQTVKEGLPDGYIAGIASSPSIDRHGHIVKVGAFDESIRKKGFDGPSGVLLLAHHDREKPMGAIRKLETVGQDLRIEAQLALNAGYVKDLYEVAKINNGLSFSVGFRLEDFEFIEQGDEEIFLIKSGELMEVSIVAFPSCHEARMDLVKTDLLESVAELERALVAKGLARSRNEAHKLFQVMKSNAHLLQDKPTLAGGDVKTAPPHPLLDASMLKPVLAELARVQSLL